MPFIDTLRATTLEESLALRVHAGYRPRKGWRSLAACTPPGPTEPEQVCPGCPVRLDCLATIMRDETTCEIGYIVDYVAVSERTRRRLRLPKAIEHGTTYGYRQHRDRGEDACAACKQASARRKAINKQKSRDSGVSLASTRGDNGRRFSVRPSTLQEAAVSC